MHSVDLITACLCLLLQDAPSPIPEVELRALEAIGVDWLGEVPVCPRAGAGQHNRLLEFRLPGVLDADVEVSFAERQPHLHFAPLSEVEPMTLRWAPCSECAWGWPESEPQTSRTTGLPGPLIHAAPTTMEIVQVGESAVARGAVDLWSSGATLRIERVNSACGLVHEPASSFDLTPSKSSVSATLDLHSMLTAANLAICIETSASRDFWLPFTLRIPHPPFVAEPLFMQLSSAGTSESVLVSPTQRPLQRVRIDRIPACVTVTPEATAAGLVAFRIEATDACRMPHDCKTVSASVFVEGDAVPFPLWIQIGHRPGLNDAQGNAVLYGVFAPREVVLVDFHADDPPRLRFPTRTPWHENMLPPRAHQPLTWTAPLADSAQVDALAGQDPRTGQTIRIVGRTSASLMSQSTHWRDLGR